MHIKADKEILQRAVTIADSVISSKNVNTILSNCMFNVSKDHILIMATDNEIAIRTTVDVTSDSEGQFAVNGKKLNSILKELPNDDIEIEVDQQYRMRITSLSSDVKGHYDLIGIDTADYPEISEFTDDSSMEIDQVVLREMIRKVAYAASHDTIKPVFNGIYFISENGDALSLVATDSRRLSLITRDVAPLSALKEGIIIPLKTMNEIQKLLDVKGICRFALDGNQCFFKINETEVISRIVDGQYPNFRQVIPREFVTTTIIDTKKFIESLKRVLVFTREPANKVIMNFTGDKLVLSAQTPDLGEAEEELLIETEGESSMTVGVNALFMIDALKEIDSDTITLGLTGQMSPIAIQPVDDDNVTAVVMPIQIKN